MTRMMKITGLAALLSLGLASAESAWAKAEFTASEACEAYRSTKRLDNPGGARLEAGKSYPLLKSNRPTRPEWYLLRLDSANPPDRWVKAECGKMEAQAGGKKPAGEACGLANQADGYVFAVSWQPAFCESKPDKAECKIDDPKVYQATHFTLHGLWPNKSSCGTNYGYCGEVKAKPANFCDYPKITLSPTNGTSTAPARTAPSTNTMSRPPPTSTSSTTAASASSSAGASASTWAWKSSAPPWTRISAPAPANAPRSAARTGCWWMSISTCRPG
jgi:hypothetical protein